MLDGRDVLARGGDDHFLLAVHHLEEAVVVDLADVAGVHPAVVVDQLGARLGVLVVAAGVHRAAGEDLAVLGDRDLDAGLGAADGAEPEAAGTAGGDRAGGLGHPVDVVDRQAEAGEEPGGLERHRRRRAAGPGHAVEAEHRLHRGEHGGVRRRRTSPAARGWSRGRTAATRRTPGPTAIASATACFLASSVSIASRPPMPVWIFSQTRGTPKKRVGRTSPSAPTSWAGSPIEVHVARRRPAGCRCRAPARRCARRGGRRRRCSRPRARRCGCCSRPRRARCGG